MTREAGVAAGLLFAHFGNFDHFLVGYAVDRSFQISGEIAGLGTVERAAAGYLLAEQQLGRVQASADTEALALAVVGVLRHVALTGEAASAGTRIRPTRSQNGLIISVFPQVNDFETFQKKSKCPPPPPPASRLAAPDHTDFFQAVAKFVTCTNAVVLRRF